ncbi:exported protein of unknown function [Nitrospira japonica]|uniref:DUF3558 domain-containing protein n=2 Tax=Nitrospira japonica TaxID=1325564 RepID=A0A1W1I6T1_9BACT|nr:exported protein of unknown function [Nitrospira japonica]
MKPLLLMTAAGLIAIFTAMQGEPSHAAAAEKKPSEPNACSLLSIEELGRLLGSPIRRPRPDTAEKGTACRFSVGGTDTLNISLWPTTPKSFDEFKKTLSDGGARLENVAGVGDAGYYWDTRIYVRTGDNGVTVWFGVSVDGVNQKRRQQVFSVAQAAVNRLR